MLIKQVRQLLLLQLLVPGASGLSDEAKVEFVVESEVLLIRAECYAIDTNFSSK